MSVSIARLVCWNGSVRESFDKSGIIDGAFDHWICHKYTAGQHRNHRAEKNESNKLNPKHVRSFLKTMVCFRFSRRFFGACFVFVFAVRASFAHTLAHSGVYYVRIHLCSIIISCVDVPSDDYSASISVRYGNAHQHYQSNSSRAVRQIHTDMPTYGRITLIRAHRHRARARTTYSNWHSNLLNFCVLCVQKYSLLCLFSNSTRIPYCVTTMRALSAQRKIINVKFQSIIIIILLFLW